MERKSCPFFSNPSCIELKVWNLKFLFPLPKFCSLLPSFCSQELHKLWMKLITKRKLYIYGSHEMLPHNMNYVGVEFSIQTNWRMDEQNCVFIVIKFCTQLISTIWKLDDKPNCDYGSNLLHNVCLAIWMHWIT
jgi:hypothetical protein